MITFDKWLMKKHGMTFDELKHLPDDEIEKYEIEYKADIKCGMFLVKEGVNE